MEGKESLRELDILELLFFEASFSYYGSYSYLEPIRPMGIISLIFPRIFYLLYYPRISVDVISLMS